MLKKAERQSLTLFMFLVLTGLTATWSVFLTISPVKAAATRTWDGEGLTNNWSEAANWTDDTVPVAGDTAYFDGTSTKNAVIDAGFSGSLADIEIMSGYTGVISQERALVLSDDFTQADGFFTGSTQNISVAGDFSLTGGSFTSTSGILTLSGNFSHTAGTFVHNSGQVKILPATAVTITGDTTWFDLTIATQVAANTVSLAAGSTQTIADLFRVSLNNPSVASGLRTVIQSTMPGIPAFIDPQNKYVLSHVSLADIENISGSDLVCAARCVDAGQNDGFDFSLSTGVTVSDPENEEVSESGTYTTFTVVLKSRPNATVTIDISSEDTGEVTVLPASLVFTAFNWETPQTVTLTGVDDSENDGAQNIDIVLDPLSSADIRFDGAEVRDLSIFNNDNESGGAAIEFDEADDFMVEDVSGGASVPVTYFDHFYNGHGTLKAGAGGAVADLSASNILPGCRLLMDDEWYDIVKTVDASLYSYNVTLSKAGISAPLLGTELAAASGTVETINCLELASGQVGFSEALIDVEQLQLVGAGNLDSIAYDPINNAFWLPLESSAGTVNIVDADTGDVSTVTAGNNPAAAVYDSGRDAVWIANKNDDTVTGFLASTGGYLYGTFGASTFPVDDQPFRLAYDSTHDKLWVGHYGSDDTLLQLNPETGGVTASLNMEGTVWGVTYDSMHDRIWAVQDEDRVLVEVNAATANFAAGSFSDSRHPLPTAFFPTEIIYDSVGGALWVNDINSLSSDLGYVMKMDASNGSVIGVYETSSGPIASVADPANERVLFSGVNVEGLSIFETLTGRSLPVSTSTDCPYAFGVANNGDLWLSECFYLTLDRVIEDGVAADIYQTVMTTDSSQIAVSDWTSIFNASVSESLNDGEIYYTLSFDDRRSFRVWNNGWRIVATDLATVHGGNDGDWYYLNDADSWLPAAVNSGPAAVSAAIENGPTNNRMTGSELSALTEGFWRTGGGFDPGVDALDLTASFYADDYTVKPSLTAINFNYGTGQVNAQTFVTNAEVSLAEFSPCTDSGEVNLLVSASGAEQILFGNDSEFTGAEWQAFVPSDDAIAYGADGRRLYVMNKTWPITSQETQTVYIRLKTASGNLSNVLSLFFNPESDCVASSITDTELSVIPGQGESVTTQFSREIVKRYVRSAEESTVYADFGDNFLRPFLQLPTFLTWSLDCRGVEYVESKFIKEATIGEPMLPYAGSVLVKIPQFSNRVYAVTGDPLNPTLRWVTNEELAGVIYGLDWNQMVIDLLDNEDAYVFGPDIIQDEGLFDGMPLLSSHGLTGAAAYQVFIINPDGTRRTSDSSWVKMSVVREGVVNYSFEDKGGDFDFDDVSVMIDSNICLALNVKLVSADSGWSHKIGVSWRKGEEEYAEAILWADDKMSVGEEKVLPMTTANSFRAGGL